MKVNQPINESERLEQEQSQRKANKSFSDDLKALAVKVKNEEPLTGWERHCIVAALEASANNLLKWQPSEPVGAPVKVPEDALLAFYVSTNMQGFGADKKTKASAISKLAKTYGDVAADTVRKRLRELDDKPEVRSLIDFLKSFEGKAQPRD